MYRDNNIHTLNVQKNNHSTYWPHDVIRFNTKHSERNEIKIKVTVSHSASQIVYQILI